MKEFLDYWQFLTSSFKEKFKRWLLIFYIFPYVLYLLDPICRTYPTIDCIPLTGSVCQRLISYSVRRHKNEEHFQWNLYGLILSLFLPSVTNMENTLFKISLYCFSKDCMFQFHIDSLSSEKESRLGDFLPTQESKLLMWEKFSNNKSYIFWTQTEISVLRICIFNYSAPS